MSEQKRWSRECLFYIGGALLLAMFVITRFWRITVLPSGLHIDEIGMAYDAWSLAQYGFDRHLKSWPVYLNNFGGGQSSLYCFLCAGLFKLFGYHVLLVRLPGILASLLLLVFGMLLTKKVFPLEPFLPFLTGLLIVVCPYFILASRFGLDCNLMLGFSTVFLYFFTCAIEKGQYGWHILAGLSGGVVLYTYAISYLVLPIFLCLSLVYVILTGKFSVTHWIVMAILMGVLAFPLILVQIVNIFELPEMSLGIFTITRLYPYRGSELGAPRWIFFLQTLRSIFTGDDLIYNSIPGIPNLYFITPPLFFLGLVHSLILFGKTVRKREFKINFFPLFWLIGMLVIGSVTAIVSNKINGAFFVAVFLAVEGIYVLVRAVKKYTGVVMLGIAAVYCACFVAFSNYYYMGEYTAENYPLNYFQIPVTEAVEFLENNPQYQNKGTYMAQTGICFALSTLQSPAEIGPIEEVGTYNVYYHTGALGEIEEGYNYIVTDIYVEYAGQLRDLGYEEIKYPNYSLFYLKNWQE